MAKSADDQLKQALDNIGGKNEFKRKRGIETLGNLSIRDEHVLALLVRVRESDTDASVRKAAEQVLLLPEYQAALREAEGTKKKNVQLAMERLKNGKAVYLYETIYLPVDSRILDKPVSGSFSIAAIQRLGLYGWDVIAVVPRTEGIALSNASIGSVVVSGYRIYLPLIQRNP